MSAHSVDATSSTGHLPTDPDPSAALAAPVEIPEVRILQDHRDASTWSTFYRLRYQSRRPGHDWIEGEREFLDRGDAVALLPYCPENGNILLTRQFRMPIYVKRPEESLLLEVCGGILDEAEPATGARREAMEELGIELGTVEPVFEAYSTPGSVCEKVFFFIAAYRSGQTRFSIGGLRHEGEEIEVVELPLPEAMRLIRSRQICDARTVALILYLVADGRCSE